MFNLTDEQKEALGIKDERKDHYFKVENAVVDNPEVFDTDREFIVFIVLSRYCNGGVGYPGLDTLAKKSRCSKKNMLIALKGLIEKGLVKKVQRHNPKNNSYQSNLYAIQNIKEYVVKDKELNNNKNKDVTKDKDNDILQGVVSPATLGGSVASDTRVVSPATPNKEQVIKNNNIKNHDHDNHDIELDFFENLFKEFGINFTTTNKESVLRLRKSLSLKDVELYLRETYQAIIENKDVINVPALFSAKIAKGERQINSKPKTKKNKIIKPEIKNKELETIEKEIEKVEVIKETKEIDFVDQKINELEKEEQAINDSLDKYSKLDQEKRYKIEEKAIELLCKSEKLEKGFIMGARKNSPNIYMGMIRKYIHECINQL